MASKSKAAERTRKAAEMRAAQARRERNRRILTIVGVLALMAVIVGGGIFLGMKNKKEIKAAPAGASDYGVSIGTKDAPHEVVIYEDFLCPFCRELEDATREELTQLASDGEVFVEYRPFNLLGGEGRTYPIRAANAFAIVLEKSGPEVAKEFHDLLYENQPSEQNPDAEMSNDDIIDLAVKAGAKESDIRPGVEKLSHEDWVNKASEEAHAAGVDSTPTIVLDGERFEDGRSVDDLARNLIKAVK
ncbi:MAG: DsbA family protein [Nocardioidaceae bacterium]|nr:DsbA family protein [Nocardioidaceae bacterium]